MLIFRASFLFAYNRSAGHNAAVDEEQGEPKSQIVAVQQCVNVGNKFLGVCFINACHLVNVVTTEDERNKLTKEAAKCKDLNGRIAEVAEEITRLTDAVNGYAVVKRCLAGNNCNISPSTSPSNSFIQLVIFIDRSVYFSSLPKGDDTPFCTEHRNIRRYIQPDVKSHTHSVTVLLLCVTTPYLALQILKMIFSV